MGLMRRSRLSEDDKKAYKQLLLIAVLAIFGIAFIVAITTAYSQWACIQFAFRNEPVPAGCGGVGKFVLEFMGLMVGVLGAIKLLGQ
jgi:predicted membrane metal-binding protein